MKFEPRRGGSRAGTGNGPKRRTVPRGPGARPLLVAIVGGSGSGKTRLGEHLQRALRGRAARLALDDFYRDRSHLAPAQRAQLNFDHPRAIDWPLVERVLRACLAGRTARVAGYDFKSHCRLRQMKELKPKPIILMDGLWLLRRPALRRLFAWGIFLECSSRTRLQRRLARDVQFRGRTASSIRRQFWRTVEPMHRRYVEPQARWADSRLQEKWGPRDVRALADRLLLLRPEITNPKRHRAGRPAGRSDKGR